MTVNIFWHLCVLLEPSLRNKWFRIGAPELFIAIGEDNRRMQNSSFGNYERTQNLSRCRFNRVAQWYNVVFHCLALCQHISLLRRNSHTTRDISSNGGWSLNVSWTTASRYGNPDVNWSHIGSHVASSRSSSLNLRCFSGCRANSISAHWQYVKNTPCVVATFTYW